MAYTRDSEDLDRFLAFPRDRHNTLQTDQTDKAIKALIGDDKVYSYVSPYFGVSFWLAPMTPDQQDKVKKLPGVSHISKNDLNGLADDSVLPRVELTLNKSEDSSNDLRKREGDIEQRSETTNNILDDSKLAS